MHSEPFDAMTTFTVPDTLRGLQALVAESLHGEATMRAHLQKIVFPNTCKWIFTPGQELDLSSVKWHIQKFHEAAAWGADMMTRFQVASGEQLMWNQALPPAAAQESTAAAGAFVSTSGIAAYTRPLLPCLCLDACAASEDALTFIAENIQSFDIEELLLGFSVPKALLSPGVRTLVLQLITNAGPRLKKLRCCPFVPYADQLHALAASGATAVLVSFFCPSYFRPPPPGRAEDYSTALELEDADFAALAALYERGVVQSVELHPDAAAQLRAAVKVPLHIGESIEVPAVAMRDVDALPAMTLPTAAEVEKGDWELFGNWG